eukprot:SAG11_NODE_25520_length_357_cov_18.972868_1_plen_55_part_10
MNFTLTTIPSNAHGTILADRAVRAHSTMQELAEKAGNHETEEGKKLCAEWGKMCA